MLHLQNSRRLPTPSPIEIVYDSDSVFDVDANSGCDSLFRQSLFRKSLNQAAHSHPGNLYSDAQENKGDHAQDAVHGLR
jgi:hypothetical protein